MKEKPTKISDVRALGLQFLLYITMLFIISMVLSSCDDHCEVEYTYTYYEPVYTSLEDLRSAVQITEPASLETTGKIFYKDHYLYINEPNKGVHVINNEDPSNPKNIAFITIPGSFDLNIRGNLLYSDSYMDLVIIDISDISNAIEIGRVNNVFNNYNSYGFYVDAQLGVVTDWHEVERVNITESTCGNSSTIYNWGMYYADGIALPNTSRFESNIAVSPSNPGMAGSMARFAITKDHLYVLDQDELIPFDLRIPDRPLVGERKHIDWGIETIFPAKDHLFIGAQNGMHIINLDNPLSPTLRTTYNHINSCDPVVVDGDYAFVTLRSGNTCAGFTNQLEVIDISDLDNPVLEYVFSMSNPHGLGKDGEVLFICDGTDGLKIYDTNDLENIDQNQLAHYKDIQTFDVIPFNHVAMMIGSDGLYQYDYSDLNNISLLSHIKVGE